MNKIRLRTIKLLSSFLLLLGLAIPASSQTPIWHQPWDVQGTLMWSARTPDFDKEIADDFDLVGRIDRVDVRGGYTVYFGSPPMNLQGAYVRFYASTAGSPGALQYERFVPADQIVVDADSVGNYNMNIVLPQSFTATGKHFLSVQAVCDLGWSWNTSNTVQPRGSLAQIRDRQSGGSWSVVNQSDTAFTLYGEVLGAPRIDTLSDGSLPKSGRLRIFGTNFGQQQGNGTVTIGGHNAIVTRWTMTTIHAYIPEQAPLGSNLVQVQTSNGASNTAGVTVTDRTSPGGRVAWRFQLDSIGAGTPPVVAPDGTIYVMDDFGKLYALNADGGLLWASRAGFQGSRLDRGPDGTLYTMADGILTAINPDGSIKWEFTHPSMNWTLSGPTVGPDGNIYGTVQYGLGFFSVTPEGQLRWSNARVGDRTPRGHRIVFSHGQAYINHTHLDFPNEELMAFDMDSGQLQWIRDAHRDYQPLIGPEGRIYVENLMGTWASLIYNPDGSLFLRQEGSIGGRNFSPDLRKLYTGGWSTTLVQARDSLDLGLLWSVDAGSSHSPPVPDKFDRILLTSTDIPGTVSSMLALTTGGEILWREFMPLENGGRVAISTAAVYSPDAKTAYAGTYLPGQNEQNEYGYLYAFNVGAQSVSPEAMQMSQGGVVSGGLADLLESDDARLVLKKDTSAGVFSPISLVVDGRSATETASLISVIVESHSSQAGIAQTVEAYNFVTGSWVKLGTASLPLSDTVRTYTIPSGAGSYLQPGTGKLRIRITFNQTARSVRGYNPRIDQVKWTVE